MGWGILVPVKFNLTGDNSKAGTEHIKPGDQMPLVPKRTPGIANSTVAGLWLCGRKPNGVLQLSKLRLDGVVVRSVSPVASRSSSDPQDTQHESPLCQRQGCGCARQARQAIR